MWDIDLIESIKALKIRFKLVVVMFYSILLGLYIIVGGVNFCSFMQSMSMKKFHLGVHPFGRWAMCQFFPSMYSFHNEILISPRLLPADFKTASSPELVRFTVNHYPMRMIYFTNERQDLTKHLPFYVYLRSRFRNKEMVSSYIIYGSKLLLKTRLLNFYERTDQ
jgi:hypothetical protein